MNISDFHWGVSSAAAQTEGAILEDGKSASIWDEFSKKEKHIQDGSNTFPGTDFYHRYREDIDIIKSLNIPNFRFSLSWPRILPNGTGEVNSRGIEFYNKVIDYCLEKNITPWITLYHWDLPQVLEDKGGWTNRDIVNWFSEYVTICTKHFGDRVKNWMVLNEPMAYAGAGYFLGVHAPGKRGRKNFVSAAHHAVLANAAGAKIIRNNVTNAFIGTTLSLSLVTPFSNNTKDIEAAERVHDLINNFFLYPMLGKGYPLKKLKFLNSIQKVMRDGDENKMKADLDFIGVQTYTREVVKHSWLTPFIKATMVSAKKRNAPYTQMGWEVYPESIYQVLKELTKIPGMPPLIVTENGAAFADVISPDGSINDVQRQNYLEEHIQQVLKAKSEGVDVKGYFAWSLTDNFEWAEGYRPRFGLVHIDYENNLKRTIKESGKWYGAQAGM